jgi:predicted nuclease of predicted toxin-antitoxin system
MARLLFDQNLSPRLVTRLAGLFPGSGHVRDVGLSRADDAGVWKFAGENGLAIVTKDGDFHQMSFVPGLPPKVV